MPHAFSGTITILLIVLTAAAAFFDLRNRRIPNWLSMAGCASGLAANTTLSGLVGLRDSALGLGLGFALYFPLWLLGARGAGDVKLLAAAGSVVGPSDTFVLFIVASLLGGVLAMCLILMRGAIKTTAANVVEILASFARLRRPQHDLHTKGALRLPHAPVIFLASVALVLIAGAN